MQYSVNHCLYKQSLFSQIRVWRNFQPSPISCSQCRNVVWSIEVISRSLLSKSSSKNHLSPRSQTILASLHFCEIDYPYTHVLTNRQNRKGSKVVCNLPLHSCLLQARFEIVGPSHVFFMHVLVLLSNPPEQVTEHEDQSDQGPQPRKYKNRLKQKSLSN
jgi:hypothetical protein